MTSIFPKIHWCPPLIPRAGDSLRPMIFVSVEYVRENQDGIFHGVKNNMIDPSVTYDRLDGATLLDMMENSPEPDWWKCRRIHFNA